MYGAMLDPEMAYVGGFVHWAASGHGTRYFSDGAIYSGQWEDGAFHGVGELKASSAAAARAAADAEFVIRAAASGQIKGGAEVELG